jgi:enoyl-[acyl-carrier protein] reductase III
MTEQAHAVLITGGTRGIGRALALHLAAEGRTVLLSYRTDERAADEALAAVHLLGGRGVAIKADLREPGGAAQLAKRVASEVDRLDAVVANAAASAFKPLAQIKAHHIDKTMTLTLTSFLELSSTLTPQLANGGRILAVSGWDSFRVLPGHGLLGAAKAALETLVRYLAVELAAEGITAIGVTPGPVDTDSFRYYGGEKFDSYTAEWGQRTPLGSIATPEELAPILAFLLQKDARWFNGQTLVADGGLSLTTMPLPIRAPVSRTRGLAR